MGEDRVAALRERWAAGERSRDLADAMVEALVRYMRSAPRCPNGGYDYPSHLWLPLRLGDEWSTRVVDRVRGLLPDA